ncbi:tyrosine-type recombinase/integrase [Bacillus sp. AFS088145]|uniref:tyrosine-type recombinase/integrase n=1 Tax=Bacillus sp. AFS088145 TaxID=2033514 RepID=UPI000BF3E231|nr:tyrosine-type recombinase/integrase [Bacillus sp. AFS088145]PFH83594.1 hypothetical protein COI44_17455 [Bacillus sp. AFS088145]
MSFEIIDVYLSDCEVKGFATTTIRTKRMILQSFSDWLKLNGNNVERVNVLTMQKYILFKRNEGLKNVTINNIIKVLKVFFKWCIEMEIYKINPMDKISKLHEPKTMIKTFTDKDIKRMVGFYSGGGYYPTRNKTMIVLLVETGIRSNELINIKLDDIMSNAIKIHGKGNKDRVVPISNHLKKQLFKYLRVREKYAHARTTKATSYKVQNNPYLFVNKLGNKLGSKIPLRVLQKCGEDIEVDLLVHSLRRYYIQKMNEHTDLFTIMKLVGHDSIETTQIYLNSTVDEKILAKGLNSPLNNI